MTAKEMFEKLDYLLNKSYDEELWSYVHVENSSFGERTYGITFNLYRKEYHVWYFGYDKEGKPNYGMNLSIDMKLLKAIVKQCEELGWL